MIDKIEIFRGANGFVLIHSRSGISEMLIFPEWQNLIEYLNGQAEAWGTRYFPEILPKWDNAPKWATGWKHEAHWIGDAEEKCFHSYSESRPEVDA